MAPRRQSSTRDGPAFCTDSFDLVACGIRSDRTIFDEPHHQSLELLAVEALAQGDAAAAYKLADRRCRISPLPEPHSHVLRAESSFRLGEKFAALSDIASALQRDPKDIAANRRMLAWGEGADKRRAALALLERDRNIEVLRYAIEALRCYGESAFANVTVLNDLVEGWAAWDVEASLEITVSDGVDRFATVVEPDPTHPFGDGVRASNFQFSRPKSSTPQSVLLSVAGRVFYSILVPGNAHPPLRRRERPPTCTPRDRRVTVIVPVYGDYEATRVCLESLLRAVQLGHGHQVLLVNDATPDDRLADYLGTTANRRSIELLTNERNLGFVGAVNRALEHIEYGDIVLLNADTIVPVGFIDRLAAAAQSSSDIGTVTPLSNNGDIAGFPVPNIANALVPLETTEKLDKIAAKVNAGQVVDIPNGTGFCLYVTRECLNAVGFLSERFHRGYLEDADFCLRAREYGFRNVCAPSVYVGHAGSKSFGAEKRSLVVRNLAILERRFPRYRLEYGAYSLLDPLKPCRAAIERQVFSPLNPPNLLLTGPGIVGAIARARASELASRSQPVLILEVRHEPLGPTLRIFDSAGGVPQSIQFTLKSAVERDALFDYVQRLRPTRIEILDPTRVPLPLIDLLLDLGVPYDVFIADAGWFDRGDEAFCLSAIRSARRRGAALNTVLSIDSSGVPNQRLHDIVEAAERILVPCEHAHTLAASFLPQLRSWRIQPTGIDLSRRAKRPQKPTGPRLGLLPLRGCAEEQWLMSEVACALRITRPDVSLTILGATLDDIGLMRFGNTFVTGAVQPAELQHLVKMYELQSLFVSVTRPVFGHPLLVHCFRCSLPLAFFDWSMGRLTLTQGDLALDPRSSLTDIVTALGDWACKQ
jgi:GT2 family glycosyltransferase